MGLALPWEAGLAILQGKAGGFWVHAQDTRYRYKALKVGTAKDVQCLGFDTEAYGPIDGNLAAGGLCWRINVFQGDWQVPAREYRQWLWQAYDLQPRQDRRKPWVQDLSLAIGWCDGEPELLDALAARVDPKKILIHFSNWRMDAYDENYPTYAASDRARAFIAKGSAMGFHILPHCNSIDMDPTHPAYAALRDFQYRHIATKALQGWAWDNEKHVSLSVPNSNVALLENRPRKVMVKIHPGLSMWRCHPGRGHPQGPGRPGCRFGFHRRHAMHMEPAQQPRGECYLHGGDETPDRPGGEHPDERHGRGGTHRRRGGSQRDHRAGPVDRAGAPVPQPPAAACRAWSEPAAALNALLFDGLARTFGYSALTGRNDDEILRSDLHLAHGTMPTITGPSANDILQPNPYIRQLLERAADGQG